MAFDGLRTRRRLHGLRDTQQDRFNADLLAFLRS